MKRCLLPFLMLGCACTTAADPLYKIHLDPTMILAGYANLQVDRQLTSTMTGGAMFWHIDEQLFSAGSETSLGLRLDWFERSPFVSGWHSNAMLKVDLEEGLYARTRLKLTQTYQRQFGELFLNVGIGVQFVRETERQAQSYYAEYQSWMLPAYEISLSRAF